MAIHFTPIALGEDALPPTWNARYEELDDAIEALRLGALTMNAPDIGDFSNAEHDHTDAAGGGRLPLDAMDVDAATVGEILTVVDVGGDKRVQTASPSASLMPTGSMIVFAGASAPGGWLLCNGQAISRSTYSDLFAVIGTTYGAGNGSTTFNLPDLRGRAAVGRDTMGAGAAGRISGATTLGGSGGAQNHTLTAAQMPVHTHSLTTGAQYLRVGAGAAGGTYPFRVNPSVLARFQDATQDTAVTDVTTATTTSSSRGAGQSHNNVQPSLWVNWIIKT